MSFPVNKHPVWKISVHFVSCPPMLMGCTWCITAPSLLRTFPNSAHKKLCAEK